MCLSLITREMKNANHQDGYYKKQKQVLARMRNQNCPPPPQKREIRTLVHCWWECKSTAAVENSTAVTQKIGNSFTI